MINQFIIFKSSRVRSFKSQFSYVLWSKLDIEDNFFQCTGREICDEKGVLAINGSRGRVLDLAIPRKKLLTPLSRQNTAHPSIPPKKMADHAMPPTPILLPPLEKNYSGAIFFYVNGDLSTRKKFSWEHFFILLKSR